MGIPSSTLPCCANVPYIALLTWASFFPAMSFGAYMNDSHQLDSGRGTACDKVIFHDDSDKKVEISSNVTFWD